MFYKNFYEWTDSVSYDPQNRGFELFAAMAGSL